MAKSIAKEIKFALSGTNVNVKKTDGQAAG